MSDHGYDLLPALPLPPVPRRSRLPRLIHRIYAWVAGYHWSRCEQCGHWYGGHEPHGILMSEWRGGVCLCGLCYYRVISTSVRVPVPIQPIQPKAETEAEPETSIEQRRRLR